MSLLPPNLVNSNNAPDPESSGSIILPAQDERGAALEAMERQMIRDALSRNSNKKQVASELGIGIATLYRKIKKYSLAEGEIG